MKQEPQRAYVQISDGQVIAVYLIPNELATPELGEEVAKLSSYYNQPIHDVFADRCSTPDTMLDMIRERNLDDEEDEVPCDHEMRLGEISASDDGSGNQIVDVRCKICGASGSTIITDEDINW